MYENIQDFMPSGSRSYSLGRKTLQVLEAIGYNTANNSKIPQFELSKLHGTEHYAPMAADTNELNGFNLADTFDEYREIEMLSSLPNTEAPLPNGSPVGNRPSKKRKG